MNSARNASRRRLRRNISVRRPADPASTKRLELAKLIVSALTPLAVVLVGFYLSVSTAQRDAVARETKAAVELKAAQFAALGQLLDATSTNESRAAQFLAALALAAEHPPADKADLTALRDRYFAGMEKLDSAGANFTIVALQQGKPIEFGDAWTHYSKTQLQPLAGCVMGSHFFVLAEPDNKSLIDKIVACGAVLADARRQSCRSKVLQTLRQTSIEPSKNLANDLLEEVKAACPNLGDAPAFRKHFGDLAMPG